VQEYALFIAHLTHYAAVTLSIRTVVKPQFRHYSLQSLYDEAHKPLLLSPPFFYLPHWACKLHDALACAGCTRNIQAYIPVNVFPNYGTFNLSGLINLTSYWLMALLGQNKRLVY